MSKLQEEVVAAAKACTSEASLRKALQDLTGTAVPGGPTGPGSSPKVHESHSHGILSNLGESLEELGHKERPVRPTVTEVWTDGGRTVFSRL